MEPDTIKINEVEYVRKEKTEGMRYIICRAQNAGVFAGWLKSQNGQEVILLNARRLWYWSGAASLSQAAEEGFSNPNACKFPCEVSEVKLIQAIELLNCTERARLSIKKVPIWKA